MARNFNNLRNDKRNGKQFAYLLDAMYNAETGEAFASDAEAVRAIWAQFCEEFNHEYNRKIYPNLSERVGQWLQGLPSGLALTYWDSEIIEFGKAWGYCQTEKEAGEFVARWWSVLGSRLVTMAEALALF